MKSTLEILQKEIMYEEFRKTKNNFILETSHDDLLIVILKAHMFIEQELFKMIEKVMENPQALNLKFLLDKLQLVYAIGLIDKDIYSSLLKLNEIRNSYAHKLNFAMSERELDFLMSPLTKDKKNEFYKGLPKSITFKDLELVQKVRFILSYLCSTVVIDSLIAAKTMKERSLDLEHKELDVLEKYLNVNK